MSATRSQHPAGAKPSAALIEWSAATDQGRFRPRNEDALVALAFDRHHVHRLSRIGQGDLERSDYLFAVSDGMGGARSGEFASRMVLDRVVRLVPPGFRRTAGGTAQGYADILGQIMAAVHRDLTELGRSYEECAGMGATLSLCWFTPGWMHFGHVGDSRIYRLKPGGTLDQLSHDHSHVGWLRREGRITELEARLHPRRNALQQALGAGTQFVEPQLGASPCHPGDRFLLCSDGVVDGLWDRRLGEMLGSAAGARQLAEPLVQEAVDNSGRDNVTAIVIGFRSAG